MKVIISIVGLLGALVLVFINLGDGGKRTAKNGINRGAESRSGNATSASAGLPENSRDSRVGSLAPSGYDSRDPATFYAYVKSHDLDDPLSFQKILAELDGLPTGKQKSDFLFYVCSALGKLEAEDAFELLKDVPDEAAVEKGTNSIMSQMTLKSPEEALVKLIEELENPVFDGSARRFAKLQSNSAEGIERIRILAEHYMETKGAPEKRNLIHSLSGSPLLAGQKLVTTLLNQENNGGSSVLTSAGKSRFLKPLQNGATVPDVLSAISEIEAESIRFEEQSRFFSAVTESSPEMAFSALKNLSEVEAVRVVPSMVKRWYQMDSLESGKWVDHLERGAIKDSAIRAIINSIGDRDPVAVQEWQELLSE